MASYPRVSVDHYTRRLKRKGTLCPFLANMRFLNIRVALDFKSTPLKTFLKNLDLPQSYDCFRNTKSVGMSFYWLFGTFHVFAAGALSPSSFEPSSSNSSFSSSLTGRSQRTLVSANALGHFLRKPELKKTHVDD